MKVTWAQSLTCAVVIFSVAAARNTQSTTPRYNNYNDETINLLNDTRENILHSNRNISRNSSYLDDIHLVNDTGSLNLIELLDFHNRSRKFSVKTHEHDVYRLASSAKNITYSVITDKSESQIKKTNVTRKYSVRKKSDQHKLVKVNTISNSRPKGKYKTSTSKPLNTTSTKRVTLINKAQNVHSTKKKKVTTSRPSRPSTTSKLKLQNPHYRNYTKFRIKPSNKQVSDIPPFYPEISTFSPPYSIANSGVNDNIQDVSQTFQNPVQSPNDPFRIPLSQVVIQTVPMGNTGTKDSFGNDCPAFSVSSNVFGPQRQGCSDLNVVINSLMDQNVITDSAASAQSDPVIGQPLDAAADPVASAPVEAAPVPEAAPAASPAAGPASGGQGGGLPQLPGLPELPQLGFPDLKGLFDLLGVLWRIVTAIFGFFTNPYLYLVPIAISFGLGFLKVLATFKIFVLIPALLYLRYLYRDKPPEIIHYKHVHKPVHHHGGWFWNHNMKSVENIVDYMHPKHIRIPKMIDDFENKYK